MWVIACEVIFEIACGGNVPNSEFMICENVTSQLFQGD